MLVGLIQNAAVLVALSILYGLLAGMHDRHGVRFQLSAGLLFGFVTLMGMLLPVEYEPGIFYDARSTILTAAGLFGGWIAAAVTILIAGAYRIIEGGVGLWAGLSAILLCPLLGCLVRVMSGNRPDRLRVQHLIMVAFGTHIIVLMAQLLLPWDIALTAIKQLWIPLFFVFGIASVLIFFLLRTEERRVLTARQLRDNKDRFEQVARALGASVWTGPSGGRTLDDISGACEAVGGIPREKLLEDASIWWNAVHPKDRPSAQAAADSVTVLGQTQAEYRVIHPDGSVRWLSDSRSVFYDDAGNVTGLGGIIADITDLKNLALERETLRVQMLQAQKMEAIGRLAGSVAHDFNNLLTVINNYAALIALDLPDGHPLQEDIEQIAAAGKRGTDLTRQLLAFSRQQVSEPKIVSLNSIVAEVDSMLSRLIGKNVVLKTGLADDLWTVKADPTQLHQILMNLVVNARDAMGDAGTLTICTENSIEDGLGDGDADGVPAGEWVVLTVADTGHGMDLETQQHLFEPFFTTKKAGEGTGLGLSTVYGIVEQCGGHIRIRSEVGVGTAFLIHLPRADAEAGSEA